MTGGLGREIAEIVMTGERRRRERGADEQRQRDKALQQDDVPVAEKLREAFRQDRRNR